MNIYLSQKCWGRSCLHLAAALRAGHWRWHLGFIGRQVQRVGPRKGTASAKAGRSV